MKKSAIFSVWGKVLKGTTPFLALEITRECPLRCPGCYAYQPDHAGAGVQLRELSDFRGQELVKRALDLVDRMRPLHVTIVGGEPLVRWREVDALLPELERRGLEVQLVTSAVVPIPANWAQSKILHLVVSVDGLQPEHDRRRAPATYERVLANIRGHTIIVHCTVTRPMLGIPGYLREFTRFWSARAEVRKIWFSLYTPQEGEASAERLEPSERPVIIEELGRIREDYPKIQLAESIRHAMAHPPQSPDECLFAQLTSCISADLKSRVLPCQIGGRPVCRECGCMATAGLGAVGNFKLGGVLPISSIFSASKRIGDARGRKRSG